MNKKLPKQTYLYSLHVPVLVLALLLTGFGVYAVQQNGSSSENVLGKSEKGSAVKAERVKGNDKGQGDKDRDMVGAPDSPANELKKSQGGTSNSREYRDNVTGVAKKLETIAQEVEVEGDEGTSEELSLLSEEVEASVEVTTQAMRAVESKPKWQVVLFGSDYKNLGQLRSSLSHNTNTIRKLTRTQAGVTDEAAQTQLQEQLGTLMQERERIINVITTNESQFSLLGWVSKLFAGYDDGAIDTGDTSESTESTESTGTETSGTEANTDIVM